MTRSRYARTVALAANHSVSKVVPWVALGCGNEQNFHLQSFSFTFDYPLLNSWMIGRDINVPGPFPSRVVGCPGGFTHAPEVALFPAPISHEFAGAPSNPAYGDITQILQHFVPLSCEMRK
jgi:hypothetical protein